MRAKASPRIYSVEKYASIASYRQRHDRNSYSNGHAGPGQGGGGAERQASADPRIALLAVGKLPEPYSLIHNTCNLRNSSHKIWSFSLLHSLPALGSISTNRFLFFP